MRRIITALAAALAMLAMTAGSAFAQSAEAEALGLQVARSMFQAMSLDDIIAREAQSDAGGAFKDVKSRPEWSDYLIQALQEEVRHDMPAIERMFGRALAKDMTVEELRAGATLLQDPTMQAALAAGAAGKEPAMRPSRAVERILSTAAGRSFLQKMENIDKIMDPLLDEFIVELMPGALRRFADKADAGEAARDRVNPR